MLQLGWKAGPEQYGPNELLDYAIAAEEAGFDCLETSDHFQPWAEAGQTSFAWTWLGAVAARTQRIRIGTGVTCPILRYNPAIIAQASATLSAMAPGRTFLSVGTGEALNEYAATGVWPGYADRQNRLAEAIDLIRALWTGEKVSFDGVYYETRKAKLYTQPAENIPMYVSALVAASAGFVGQYGDGLITVSGKGPDVYRQMLKNFTDGAANAGKDGSKLPRLIEIGVAYTDDTQSAIESIQTYWAGAFVPALYNQKIYTPRMSQENGIVIGPDTIQKMWIVSGNPDDHVQCAQQYLAMGFDQLFFHSAGPDQRAFIEGYAKDVLPRLRQAQTRRATSRGLTT